MRLIVLSTTLVAAVMVNCRILLAPVAPEFQHSNRAIQQDEETMFTSEQPLDFDIRHLVPVAVDEIHRVDDMLLDEEQWAAVRLRKARDDSKRRWSEGSDSYPLVPYRFIDPVNRDAVRAGLNHWMKHTCIRFEETININQPHLQFRIAKDENGKDLDRKCSSNVGMTYYRNGQSVNIGRYCTELETVAHEIGHAMGFYHEQSRSDRDDYLTIQTKNIINGTDNINFDQHIDNNYSIPYDYSSIMHYKEYYFSKERYNKLTIETKDPLALELLGSGTVLSHRDKLLANRMYNCTVKWLTTCGNSSDPCMNNGYIGENCTCICPPGTSGSLCQTVFEDYYAHLRNPISEEISTEKSIKVETPIEGYKFVKWIVPPKCKKATLTFENSNMNKRCKRQFLHVKTNPSDITGRILCAEDVKRGVTLMSETKLVITMFNKIDYGDEKVTLWEADVTFQDIIGCTVPGYPTTTTTSTTTTSTSTSTSTLPVSPPMGCSVFSKSAGWAGHISGSLRFISPVAVTSWELELIFDNDLRGFTTSAVENDKTSGRKITLQCKKDSYMDISAGQDINWWIQMEYAGTQEPQIISARLIAPAYPSGVELC